MGIDLQKDKPDDWKVGTGRGGDCIELDHLTHMPSAMPKQQRAIKSLE